MSRHRKATTPSSELEIPSYTVLLTYRRFEPIRRMPTRIYEIFVKLSGDILYRTGDIPWTRNGLDDGIRKIQNYFHGVPPKGCEFLVRIFDITKDRPEVKVSKISIASSDRNTVYKQLLQPTTTNRGVRGSNRGAQTGVSTPFDRNATKSIIGTHEVTNSSGGHTVNQYSVQTLSKIVSSVRTPHFKKAERAGTLPENPYSMKRTVISPGGGSREKKTFFNGGQLYGWSTETWTSWPYLTIATADASHLSIDDNALIGKLASRISGPGANVGEDIATFRQTTRMFTSKVDILRTSAHALANVNLNKWSRIVQAPVTKSLAREARRAGRHKLNPQVFLAELWLEYRYGWLPLLSDCEALVSAFSRLVTKNPTLGRVTASTTKRSDTRTAQNGYLDGAPLQVVGYLLTETSTSRRFILKYQLDSVILNTFSNLGLTSPVLLGWELVPFSFVVDWFLPVGNALAAFSAFEGLTFKSGCAISFTKKKTSFSIDGVFTAPEIPNVQLGSFERISASAFADSVLYSRTPLSGFPSPKLPQFKNPISTIHAANAVALLTVLLSGRSRL